MGYKCDVCETEEGAVYCLPDNAVMCAACDLRCELGVGALFSG